MQKYKLISVTESQWHDRREDPVPCRKIVIQTPYTPETHASDQVPAALQKDLYGLLQTDIRTVSIKVTADAVFKRRKAPIRYFDFRYQYQNEHWAFSYKDLETPDIVEIKEYLAKI